MLRSLQIGTKSSRSVLNSIASQRSLHTVPKIETIDELKDTGLKGLYSAKGLESAWYSRAQSYVNNLNKESTDGVAGGSLEDIISTFYKEPIKRSLYENASLLYNTKFALECLAPINTFNSSEEVALPPKATVKDLLAGPVLNRNSAISNVPTNNNLKDWLVDSFGSIVEFKTVLLNSAMAIKGDGFAWLVVEKLVRRADVYETMFVLNTYHCGQPNSNASKYLDDVKLFHHTKEQENKLKDPEAKLAYEEEQKKKNKLEYSFQNTLIETVDEAKSIHHATKRRFVPILAIDASPKAYLHDYGVFGKKQYLERVWESIDWDKIAARLPQRSEKLQL